MRLTSLIFFLLIFLPMSLSAQSPEQLAKIWDEKHITKIAPSDVRHSDLKNYLERLKKIGLKVDEVGRSYADREIYQVEFGHGPFKVFMWSQMHGDEPTATSALIDMFAYLQTNRSLDWVKQIEENLTIRAVPMLNPDGEELYQRRSLQNIDINRDAKDLKTPEGQLLKKLRDDWNPNIGFNLHNQQSLTTVGHSNKQATISLLVVYGDAAKTTSEGLERNRRVASAIVSALQKFIPDNIAKYDDEYTATAFGDNFTAWGTPVILIETGALNGKDEMYLVRLNFVAFLTALHVLADGSEKNVEPDPYDRLVGNSSGSLYNLIFRDANLVEPGTGRITTGDIAINIERRRASFPAPNYVRAIGDLNASYGLEEYSAAEFNVYPRWGSLKVGDLAEFLFYKKDRTVDWTSTELEKQFPPDAIFSGGKWIKGEGIVPRK
jgi:Zinc carboxypeptidase